ncbi:MAG: hypothetical protein IJH75_06060 [Mogibacterium sp.]|nr:hypothetical protein [Mogibacterium sp.]
MRFTEEETDRAIRIVTEVQRRFGEPLEPPETVLEYRQRAEEGDPEAYVAWMTAALRMLYPVKPSETGSSPQELLWKTIQDGRLECIRPAGALNYALAWEETCGGTRRAPFGSYFDSFCTTVLRAELVRMIAEQEGTP